MNTPLTRNSLLEWIAPDGQQTVERILDVVNVQDVVHVIRIDRPDALPVARRLPEVFEGLDENRVRVLTIDPFAYLQKPEESIPANHRQIRDDAWAVIEPIVTSSNCAAYDRDARGRLIRTALGRTGACKPNIYHWLRRYWQGGMTPNALLPNFHLCGAPGKERNAEGPKRGRPRTLAKLKGVTAGINIDPETAEKLRKGYRMFYEKAPENGGLTKRQAYQRTLEKFFHRGYQRRDGVLVPVLPPAEALPSFDQFLYWTAKGSDVRDTLTRRHGERKFNLRFRPVLGDSTSMAFGPGSLYQVDSTVGDSWLVSDLNRARRLGRPAVVAVVCAFSHMIVGFHAGLENASFFTAGLALDNATLDKVKFCREHDITISPEEWPSFGLPEALLADRGELEGHSASNLVQSLGVRVDNTSPYRADLKGTVERTFRSMNDSLIHDLPGAVRKPKERGERDPRLDAVLTLREFRRLLIHAILQHNSRRIEGYRLQPDMIAAGVEPRPVDLWQWGIQNRTGHLRTADPAIIRSNLLPQGSATVTYQGIKFRGLHYSCDRAIQERWFERARASKSRPVEVGYDPRTVDVLFLRGVGGGRIEPCKLLEPDQRFQHLSWAEVDDFFLSQKEAREGSKSQDLQSKAVFHANRDAIVGHAIEQGAIANQGLTKAARLRGVLENRKAEMQAGSAVAMSQARGDAPAPAALAPDDKSPAEPAADLNNYVPPPSPLEMLRAERASIMKPND